MGPESKAGIAVIRQHIFVFGGWAQVDIGTICRTITGALFGNLFQFGWYAQARNIPVRLMAMLG